MRGLFSHLRYTVRRLMKSPGFTVTAVLILGLGIGANTAIFSLVNCVLLKPLPYPNPDRLVLVYQVIQGDEKSQFDYPDYLDVRANQRTLDSLTAFYPDDFTLTGRGEPERISGIYVSGSLFKVLGRPFLIGKPFGETEDNSETRSVVVISEHLWNTKFQRDPHVLGANLLLNGRSFEIVGVTPAQANELGKVELVEKGFATKHLSMLVVSLFSGAALLLAAVGLYGVLSYSVSQRKRELGIRVAVGAQAWNIFRLVVTQGLLIGATGLVVGLAGALIFAHFIQAALYRVPSTDPPTLIAAAAVLWLTALMACLLPALRATRIDPIQALRE